MGRYKADKLPMTDIKVASGCNKKSKRNGKRKMNKKEIREKAKDVIQEALAVAYYRIADGTEEANEIIAEMDKICERLCKQIGRKHYTL